MHIHHLSHIDLDGYGCQLVSSEIYKNIATKMFFYNANYGKEVMARIEHIIKNIKQNKENKAHIIISDLNLTLSECQSLKDEIFELNLNGYSVSFELLDHHKSGAECAAKYEWYVLDTTRCATKIVYDTLSARYEVLDLTKSWLSPMVDMINSVDLWCENSYAFEFGKVAMRIIAECREFSRFMFDDDDRGYKLHLLKESSKILGLNNNYIELDNSILGIKKRYLGGELNSDSIDNLISNFQNKLLSKRAESSLVYCDGYRGFLSYGLGSISVVANLFLKTNCDFDFFIDVNTRGNVSLRANNKCDVSAIASKYFEGGGHFNASGGKIEGFKESFLYDDIKVMIEEIFKGDKYE